MSPEIVTIIALIVIFAIATFLPINMGALAFTAAFIVGTLSVGLTTDDILTGFPAELVVTLIGVTYLFAIAQNNGTVDLLVRGAVRLVGGHVAAQDRPEPQCRTRQPRDGEQAEPRDCVSLRDRLVDDRIDRVGEVGRQGRRDRFLDLVQQVRVEEQHVTRDREGDHQQRHQRQDREERDRRRVVVAVVIGVPGAGPDQVVEPRVAGP